MAQSSIGVRLRWAMIVGLSLVALAGCPSDPYDPDTWIEKLDDPNELEKAVQELEHLKDPKAIKALGEVWEKRNRWSRVLRVMVALADQPDAEGGPFWDDAIPVLEKAVSDFDIADRRSIDDAVFAADALGRAKNPETIQTLVLTATKKMPKLSPGQRVRIAAVRALGSFGSDKRAVSTLIKVLEAKLDAQPLQLHAAAANALAETSSATAIEPLLKALYSISPIYKQVRTALTRVGPPVTPKLMEIFTGKHKEINAYAAEEGFATDCEADMGPKSKCKAPGNLRFKAANILGDLRAKEAVPMLMAGLKDPAKVSFFEPKTGAPGPPDHNAILNALRMIGDPRAAGAVLDYMKAASTDDITRPIAIDVYSVLARDGKGMDYLRTEMLNDGQEEQIRKACALAYSRIANKKSELKPLEKLINAYAKKARESDKKAKKAKTEADKKYEERTADGYRALDTEFRQYKARADIGIKCKKDPMCYASILEQPAEAIIKALGIPGADKLSKQDRVAYRIAAIERSTFELMKLGPKAAPVMDKLLQHTSSTERIVREGVLLALIQVAPAPCEKCEKRLSEVVELQKDQTTLDFLTSDTKIVLNYYATNTGKKK